MTHIALEQALALLVEGVHPVGAETLPLNALPLGRILARPVTAALDQPPFPRSPLDGYALHAADTQGASRATPVTLPVVGRLYAGSPPMTAPVGRGQAVRIMTGAPIPPGCDCVMAQEQTDEGEQVVSLYTALYSKQNYVEQGEDFQTGQELLSHGIQLTPAALAVAAGGGAETLTVFRRPKVALLATGDELAQPGQPLKPGQIYNSNLYYLQSRLTQWGVEVVSAQQVGDDLTAIQQAMGRGIHAANLVITSGGVSVGQRDLLPAAVAGLGGETVFHGVAMKPGSPALYGRVTGVPVLALSGNPFAAAATLEVLGRPLVTALAGGGQTIQTTARLAQGFSKGSPMPRFVRGRYEGGLVTLPDGHSSGQLYSMVGCNCLAQLPAGEPIPQGTEVSVLLL